MVTSRMVFQAANEYRMACGKRDGEWRITPQELSGQKAEDVAYYTDDNEDAYMTIVAMRRVQDKINSAK